MTLDKHGMQTNYEIWFRDVYDGQYLELTQYKINENEEREEDACIMMTQEVALDLAYEILNLYEQE